MKIVVVYESLWGNTAAIARAIAEGLGQGAEALSTVQAAGNVIDGADLLVAGAPLLGFKLPDDAMRENIRRNPGSAPHPADLSHPSMRDWLAGLPPGKGRSAAFETRLWWSPGSAANSILHGLQTAGYLPLAKVGKFFVTGAYGPLRSGEIERARQWGADLALAL